MNKTTTALFTIALIAIVLSSITAFNQNQIITPKDGADGIDGVNGTNGIDGVNGSAGKTGETGPTGQIGIAGQNGKDGINGTTPQIITPYSYIITATNQTQQVINNKGIIEYETLDKNKAVHYAMTHGKTTAILGGLPLHMQSYKNVYLNEGDTLNIINVTGFAGQVKSIYITNIANFDITIIIDGVKTVDTYYNNTGAQNRGFYFFNSIAPNSVNYNAKDFGKTLVVDAGFCVYRLIDIPFTNSCTITISNYGIRTNVWTDVEYQNFSEYTLNVNTITTIEAKKLCGFWNLTYLSGYTQATLLETTGSGRFIGVNMFFDPPTKPYNTYLYLEGPVSMYTDHTSTPIYNSSGTEEFIFNTFYFGDGTVGWDRAGVNLYNPSISQVAIYRYFDNDEPIYYDGYFKLTWDHWFDPGLYLNYFVLYYTYS